MTAKVKRAVSASGSRANLKVDPAVHREIDIERATRGIPIYVLVEEAWKLYKDSGANRPLVETFIRFLKSEDGQTVRQRTQFLKEWEAKHPLEVVNGDPKEAAAKSGGNKRKVSARSDLAS